MTRWCWSPVILERRMNKNLQKLARRYTATLLKYLSGEQETVLEQAYELGRTAIAQGFGVLDMARVHQQALAKLMRSKAWRAIRFSPEQPDQQTMEKLLRSPE